jgi:hypothetical protein
MQKIIIYFIFTYLFSSPSNAQIRRDAIWCFGDSVLIDFNQSPPLFDYCATRSRGSSCSIADSAGNLLFYAHTGNLALWQTGYDKLAIVLNRNHQPMENGDSLIGELWYREMLIVPDPGNNQRYYLFLIDITTYAKLFYSIIDLTYNGGLGKVIQKNILVDSLPGRSVTDGIAAVKHGNGRDWWVVFRTSKNDGTKDNTFFKLLISPSGISPVLTQNNIGVSTYTNILRLYFNHRGNEMVLIDVLGLIELYFFDRCTGTLFGRRLINSENTFPWAYLANENWSAEFSPNDSVLYVSTEDSISYLYQYNVNAINIASTKVIIDHLQSPLLGGELRMANDNRIYWCGNYYNGVQFPFPWPDSVYNQYNMNLSVIENPNVLGTGCNFQPLSFNLGGHRCYAGLPNNPNYDLPAAGGTLCDTLGLPNSVNEINNSIDFSVFPNPAGESLTCLLKDVSIERLTVKMFDITGRLVLEKELVENIIDVKLIPSGIYYLNLYKNSEFKSNKKVIILK